jgi:hypothetical protein
MAIWRRGHRQRQSRKRQLLSCESKECRGYYDRKSVSREAEVCKRDELNGWKGSSFGAQLKFRALAAALPVSACHILGKKISRLDTLYLAPTIW